MNTFSKKILKLSALAIVILGVQTAVNVEAKTVTQQVDQYRTIRECVNVTSVSSDTWANFDPTDNKLCNSSNLDSQHRLGREIVDVTYEALLYNNSTNQPINDGATGLPIGTQIRVEDATNDGDIYHIVVISEYISGMSAGSGWISASPRAFWTTNAEGTSDWCQSSDSVGYDRYFYLSARKPTPTIYSNSGSVTCNNSTDICTITGPGTVAIEVRYPATYGNYYARQSTGGFNPVCYGNNFRHLNPSINFGQRSVTFTLNNSGGSFDNATCSGISPNSASGYSVAAGATFSPTLYMTNTGDNAWLSSSHRLVSVNSAGNQITSPFGVNSIALPRSPVASVAGIGGTAGCGGCVNPNPSVNFSGTTFTAPSTGGVYNFAYRMMKNGTLFGDICSVNYTVTGGYSCSSKPANSTFYTGDDSGLSANTVSTYSSSNTGAKCEVFCNAGYIWTGSGICEPVIPPNIVTLSAAPASVNAGGNTTITWEVTGPLVSCVASGGWSGAKPVTGSQVVTLGGSNTTFTLTCTGPGGFDSDSTSVTVSNLPPSVAAGSDVSITLPQASANTVGSSASDANGISSIAWVRMTAPTGAPSASISNANTLNPTFNSMTVPGTYTYRLTVTDVYGASSYDEMSVVVAPEPVYICTPGIPGTVSNASYYSGDDSGLSANTPATYSSSNTSTKCEYACNPGFAWTGSTCELPNVRSVDTTSLPGSISVSDSINFTGYIQNNSNVTVSQAGWAGLEIDLYSDGSGAEGGFDTYYDLPQQGNMTPGQIKNFNRTVPAGLPAGTHRYRWNVDSTGTFGESNELDNRSPWASFTVVVVPPSNPPTNLSATPGACDSQQIALSWNAVAGATSYEIRDGASVIASVPGTSHSHTGLGHGSSHSYTIRASNPGGSTSYTSPALNVDAPLDCLTLNGVNLVSTPNPSINVGSNPDGVNGTYDSFSVLLAMQNNGLGTMPAGSNVSYVATIDYASYHSNPDSTSAIGYFNGELTSTEQTGTLTRTFDDVPFGTHNVCGRVNLDGSPNFTEYPTDTTDNTSCSNVNVPVPRPPMSISSDKSLVRAGETAIIAWSAETSYPMNCTVQGPTGVSSSFDASASAPNPYTASVVTGPINNSSQFILRCTEPNTGDSFEAVAEVEVVPDYEEI